MRTLQTFADAVGLAVRWPVVLVPSVGLLVLGLVLAAVGLGGALLLNTGKALERLGTIGLLLTLGVSLITLWSFAATILVVSQAKRGEAAALGAAARGGLRKLLPLFLHFIVLAVILFVAVGIPFLVVSFLGAGAMMSGLFGLIISAAGGQAPELGGLAGFSGGFAGGLGAVAVILGLALILWALFLSVKLSLGGAAVVLGGFGPIAAVGESWGRTQGAFWRLLGLVTLVYLVGGVLEFALGRVPTVGPLFSVLGFALASYLWNAAFALAYLRLAEGSATQPGPAAAQG